jgi:sterol 3beta-glucosyltransferase
VTGGENRRKIALVTFGTRGDMQPFCVLGRALKARGHDVVIVTTGDYAGLVRRFGLDLVEVAAPFGELVERAEFDDVFHGKYTLSLRSIRMIRALARQAEDNIGQVLAGCLTAIASAGLVVYNPIAFFAGAFARELGIPAISVMSQPLLPSWRQPLSLFGGRNLGRIGNRLSYESFRLCSLLLKGAFRAARRRSPAGRALRALTNPLTLGIRESAQIMAFSPALSPSSGDWPVDPLVTGFWYDEPRPGEALPDNVLSFLAQGPPPVYIGFGSMMWGRQRNTDMVLRSLALWGGRALLRTGGALGPPGDLPANVMAISDINHMLLFPHVAAAVHHGGAGTTGTALRCGLPNVILPVLGDQLYWGGRVAAVGAGEEPVPLSTVSPEQLARRIASAGDDVRFRDGARAMAQAFSHEHGVSTAVELVEKHLGATVLEPAA